MMCVVNAIFFLSFFLSYVHAFLFGAAVMSIWVLVTVMVKHIIQGTKFLINLKRLAASKKLFVFQG